MSFEQFKKIIYHTRTRIRIPGSRTVLDKTALVNKKGKLNQDKLDSMLRKVYEEENYKDR